MFSSSNHSDLLDMKNTQNCSDFSLFEFEFMAFIDTLPIPVDFTKARGPFGPLGFKTLPILGHLQNILLPLYF